MSSALPAHAAGGDCERVLAVLGDEALHIDDIAMRSILVPGATVAALAELELTGQARQHPGARFSRRRAFLQIATTADAATAADAATIADAATAEGARGITPGEST